MTSNIFHFDRFINYFKLTAISEWKRIVMFSAISLGLALTLFFLTEKPSDLSKNRVFNLHEMLYLLSLGISGALYCGTFFQRFRSKEGTTEELMIPVSALERTLTALLWSFLACAIYHSLVYYIFSIMFNAIGPYVYEAIYRPLIITSNFKKVLFIYTFLAPIFLLGAASFRKLPIVKTLVWLTIFIGLFTFSESSWSQTAKNILDYELNKWHWYEIFKGLLVIHIPVFWFLIYLKFKEKEV